MLYLIIPIVCFVLFAGFVWALFAPRAREKTWTGKIDDLDLILSVLMTADWGEPSLELKVPRRVTWVRMTFPDSAVRLELPLVTKLQQSRRERYLAMLRDLDLDPQVSSDHSDHDVLTCNVEGPPATAARIIKDAFVGLFEVLPARELEFRAFAHSSDQNIIDKGLGDRASGGEVELPMAATLGKEVDPTKEARNGCMMALAGLLLWPIPFVIAHLQFGYIAASAVLVGIILARDIYGRWKRPGRGFGLKDLLKIAVLSLAGATIYFNDPLYLQLVPTAVLSLVAVAQLLSAAFDLPRLSVFEPAKKEDMPKPGRLLFSFSIVATSLGAAAMNEYLRANISLDAWVWFFAFFRVELVLGFLTTSIPFFVYMGRHIMKTERDSESP